jgi:hypothetical protein
MMESKSRKTKVYGGGYSGIGGGGGDGGIGGAGGDSEIGGGGGDGYDQNLRL